MYRRYANCALILLFAATQAQGRGEYQVGGPNGNLWQDLLSEEAAGIYLLFDSEGQQESVVPVGVTPHGVAADTLIDFTDNSIRPRFIDSAVNLTLTDPNSSAIKIPLPYTGGEAQTTDGCSAVENQTPGVKKQFDGDVTTAHFRRFTAGQGIFSGGAVIAGITGEGWKQAVVIDFGAAVPVNRIRFYPRLGQEDDLLLINELTNPRPELTTFGTDSFTSNFLAWYEIRIGDNDLRFANGPCDKVGPNLHGLRWIRTQDPQLTVLETSRENLDPVVELTFPTQSIRWITAQAFPLRDWEVAEFEVYGEGFVEETVFITQILDFGQPINWGKIRWDADVPKGTRIEVRTRTGDTADPSLYFAENINGDIRPISLKDYQKIDPSGRLPTVYDSENWSFWSPPYDFDAGLRDTALPASAWQDGTPLSSPGPSRYIQIAFRLFSTFTTAPHINELTLQFGNAPAAHEVLGEVWPLAVDTFAPTEFTYVIRPEFNAEDTGFDRLEILTHAQVQNVSSVRLDGNELDLNEFPPAIETDRLVVLFPRLQGEEDSFKQIEVSFAVPVLRFGTEFSGWVFDSEDPDQIKQQIRPGNSTFRFSGNALAVNTPVGGQLLVDVNAAPNPFTPNGDGLNEALQITYKLREVTADRSVRLSIYNLAGQLVIELPPIIARSGEFIHHWDGRDQGQRLVPPGTYVYRLQLDAENQEEHTGTLSVAY
ncbi:MAG: hypothetical protein HN780_22565 [Gemmatimonadetes bacterium]|nr:hypothetical protein [Gemmatimonadota bacterium]